MKEAYKIVPSVERINKGKKILPLPKFYITRASNEAGGSRFRTDRKK